MYYIGSGRAEQAGTRTPQLHRRAFSLVELLVVIGIIAFLIAILLPELRVVREIGQRTQCQSNLRQIGYALMIYSNENGGSMPSWSGWHATATPVDPNAEVPWVGKLSRILPADSRVYNCPSFNTYTSPLHNYFICAAWAGLNGRHATRFTDVKLSGRFLICADMTQPALYPRPVGASSEGTDDYDRDDYGMPCLCFPNDGGFLMHRGGNNVLFDDLHVEVFREFNPTRITFHPTRMLSWQQLQAAGPDSAPNTTQMK
jgi:prepilin-type N-terminal cleavage/methylation domain-containing protein